MLKKVFIVIGVLIAILVAGAVVIYLLPTPQAVSVNEKNSEIYSLMVAGGIENAVVDVTADKVLVTYNLPADLDKEASWFHTMGAVAAAVPNGKTLIIETHYRSGNGQNKIDTLTVQIKDVTDFLGGRLTEMQFRAKVPITTASA